MTNEAILPQIKWLHYKLQFTGRMLMKVEWVDGFEIKAVAENLADGVPGDHIHYDEHNSLKDGSAELVIERM